VDQVPVQPAISILEWVDIDKSECQDGSGDDGVHRGRILIVKGQQPIHQGGQILRPGTDMVRNWRTGHAVVRSHEPAFIAIALVHKSRVTEDEFLQAQEFCMAERAPARLPDRCAPSLDPVLRRAFALDRIAGS